MSRRRQINSDNRGGNGRLSGLSERARWPFERLLFLLEERVVWPLSETAAGRTPERRGAAAAALVAVAAVAIFAGVLAAPEGDEAPAERVARPARVAIAEAPAPKPVAKPKAEPVKTAREELQGVPPDFSVGTGHGIAGTGESKAAAGGAGGVDGEASEAGDADSSGGGSESESEASGDSAGEEARAVTSSVRKPVPAGPRAMKVARRFAEAFVFYEIGKRRDRSQEVFSRTATPRLAKALAERPPRQPAGARVPRARVVNLVPGPRAGRAYTVSVSMLRVGTATELRLELRRDGRRWRVTDVRG